MDELVRDRARDQESTPSSSGYSNTFQGITFERSVQQEVLCVFRLIRDLGK